MAGVGETWSNHLEASIQQVHWEVKRRWGLPPEDGPFGPPDGAGLAAAKRRESLY